MGVVITGASAGIGRALAEALSVRGANLTLSARRADRLEALNRELGGRHLVVPADVSRREDCERLIATAMERFGRIDTLVCNAGYGLLCPVSRTSREQMEEMFATNVLGTTDCIHAAVPHMQRQELRDGLRGQVMIVSSVIARRAIPFFGIYSATKAAQLALAEALRVELAPEKIAVTSVHPAGTDTEFGEVSASLSQGTRPRRVPGEPRQSAQTVAEAMVRGIERPRPEVWPNRPMRWAVGIGTLIPSLVDRVLSKRLDLIGGEAGPS